MRFAKVRLRTPQRAEAWAMAVTIRELRCSSRRGRAISLPSTLRFMERRLRDAGGCDNRRRHGVLRRSLEQWYRKRQPVFVE